MPERPFYRRLPAPDLAPFDFMPQSVLKKHGRVMATVTAKRAEPAPRP